MMIVDNKLADAGGGNRLTMHGNKSRVMRNQHQLGLLLHVLLLDLQYAHLVQYTAELRGLWEGVALGWQP